MFITKEDDSLIKRESLSAEWAEMITHKSSGHELEDMKNKLLKAAEKDGDVLAVVLFGSVARGEPARDVDVCLVLDPDKMEKINMAKKGLEYVLKFDLDIHLYQELPLYIQVRVLKEGKIELVKDEDRLYDIAIKTSQLFDEFRPRYEGYLGGVLHG